MTSHQLLIMVNVSVNCHEILVAFVERLAPGPHLRRGKALDGRAHYITFTRKRLVLLRWFMKRLQPSQNTSGSPRQDAKTPSGTNIVFAPWPLYAFFFTETVPEHPTMVESRHTF